jgi:RNA-dependent RNA polymerase
MELELTRIDFDADEYDVRKAVQDVLHGPELYDPNNKENKGRKPNFQIVMGISPAGRSHNGKAALRLPQKLGQKLLKWYWESKEHRIMVKESPLRLFKTDNHVPSDVKQVLEKALYIDPEQDKLRTQIEERAYSIRLRIAKVQFGVWYKPSDSPGAGRSFSIEYERDFISQSAAYLYVVYEHKLIRVDVCATLLSAQSRLHLKSDPHLDWSEGDGRNELSGSCQVLEHPKNWPWL